MGNHHEEYLVDLEEEMGFIDGDIELGWGIIAGKGGGLVAFTMRQ
jgi:hypothetical protein